MFDCTKDSGLIFWDDQDGVESDDSGLEEIMMGSQAGLLYLFYFVLVLFKLVCIGSDKWLLKTLNEDLFWYTYMCDYGVSFLLWVYHELDLPAGHIAQACSAVCDMKKVAHDAVLMNGQFVESMEFNHMLYNVNIYMLEMCIW